VRDEQADECHDGVRASAARPASRARFYSFNPSLVPATGLARDHAKGARYLYRLLTPLLELLPGGSSVRTSGAALAWVADSDGVGAAPSGSHFDYRLGLAKIWSEADDLAKCRKLFEGSGRVTGETIQTTPDGVARGAERLEDAAKSLKATHGYASRPNRTRGRRHRTPPQASGEELSFPE